MPKAVVAGLIMVVSLASAGFSDDRDTSQSGLDRLKSFGYIVTDDGIEEHSPRFVVPHNSTVTPAAIEELLQYCIAAAPAAEVVFLSPAIVEEQLRQFRQFLPHAHIRHASAVWFGAISSFVFLTASTMFVASKDSTVEHLPPSGGFKKVISFSG